MPDVAFEPAQYRAQRIEQIVIGMYRQLYLPALKFVVSCTDSIFAILCRKIRLS